VTAATRATDYSLSEIPSAIWALGFVPMPINVSSAMIQALLPVYPMTMPGASMVAVGVIEGTAEATASITKTFSGALRMSQVQRGLSSPGLALRSSLSRVLGLITAFVESKLREKDRG
jgi:hypothetical protein